jgi:hypothetical protein
MGCSGNIRPAMVRVKIISIGLFIEAITEKNLMRWTKVQGVLSVRCGRKSPSCRDVLRCELRP